MKQAIVSLMVMGIWGLGAARAAEAQAPAAPVSLADCVKAALADSPDAQAAARRAEVAKGFLTQARSAYYPQVTVAGSYGRTDNPPQAFFMSLNQRTASLQNDFNFPPDTENWRGSLGGKWMLYDGGQREAGVDMAKFGGEAALAMEEAVRSDVVHTVTRSYYGALQARAFVKVLEETVQSLTESMRVAGERVKAGSAVQTDVLNLDVRLAQSKEDLIAARNGFKLSVAALNAAIGRDLASAERLPDVAPECPAPPAAEEGDGVVEQRPELRAARLQADTHEAGWRKAKREYLPRLSAYGSADWDSDSLNDFEQSYFVGAVAEWDLFTGFRRGGSEESARASLEAARSEAARARNNLKLDLIQARIQVGESWERMGVAAKGVASAEEALRITKERYEKGAADITELLTAQVGLTASRTRDVAVRYDYLIALSNLARAEGRTPTETVKL